MTLLDALLSWATLPYLIALGVAVLFAALQLSGVLGLLAGGDHDGDADADGDADGDASADHDGDADGDHDADDAAGASLASHGFSVGADLGVGRVPLSILWQTYALAFAFAGLAANIAVWSARRALPLSTLAWSVPFSLAFGYAVTRLVGRVVGRAVSDPALEVTSRAGLVGKVGVVISSKVDGEFGEVRIPVRTGHVVRVTALVHENEPPIEEQREVVVVEYDRARDRLYVAPLEPRR